MSQDILYCGKCRTSMGYRLEPLAEVWRETWKCFVCGNVITKDHRRYDLERKKQAEAEKTNVETPVTAKISQPAEVPQPTTETTEQQATEQATTPRRRGRPSKKELYDMNGILKIQPTSDDVSMNTPEGVQKPENTPLEKKKRGRPRKIIV